MAQHVTQRIDHSGFRASTAALQGAYSAPDDDGYEVGELTGANGWVPLGGAKSFEAFFTTTEADNAALTAAIEVASHLTIRGESKSGTALAVGRQFVKGVVATLAITVGATTGDADELAIIDTTERFADTIVPTLKDFGTYLQTVFGATLAAQSPAADGIGRIGMKDLGNASYVRIVVGPNAKAHIQVGT